MINQLPAFFTHRFVQRRHSVAVAGAAPTFTHTTPPVWAHALATPPQAVERWLNTTTSEICQVVAGYSCYSQIVAPSDVQSWYIPFPFAGAMHWEEAAVLIPTLPPDTVHLIALTDMFGEVKGATDRTETAIDCLLIYPGAANATAASQSQQLNDIIGHLREAARTANAEMRGIVELAHLGNRITNEAEFPNELIGIRFRLFIRETVTRYKSNAYGMQM